ncbi:MAG: hypothetical protein KGI08_09740 [Thaumarchaeota archaeon]|nr:hypothetical protein [Nitrososphaerota archaeon]
MSQNISAGLLYTAMTQALADGLDVPFFDKAGKRIGTVVQVDWEDDKIWTVIRNNKGNLESAIIH